MSREFHAGSWRERTLRRKILKKPASRGGGNSIALVVLKREFPRKIE